MKHEDRHRQILNAAVAMLLSGVKVSLLGVAREAKVSPSLVGQHYATLPILYAALSAEAERSGRIDLQLAVTRALNPPNTKLELLMVGVVLARDVGIARLTRALVGDESGKAHGTVSHNFGAFQNFKDEVVKWAVENEDLIIIAQGLKDDNTYALQAPQELQSRAWIAYQKNIK